MYTMRQAFKRYLILHNKKIYSPIKIPNYFRYYIFNNIIYRHIIYSEQDDYYANIHEYDYTQRRKFHGYYQFNISDEELLNIRKE